MSSFLDIIPCTRVNYQWWFLCNISIPRILKHPDSPITKKIGVAFNKAKVTGSMLLLLRPLESAINNLPRKDYAVFGPRRRLSVEYLWTGDEVLCQYGFGNCRYLLLWRLRVFIPINLSVIKRKLQHFSLAELKIIFAKLSSNLKSLRFVLRIQGEGNRGSLVFSGWRSVRCRCRKAESVVEKYK